MGRRAAGERLTEVRAIRTEAFGWVVQENGKTITGAYSNQGNAWRAAVVYAVDLVGDRIRDGEPEVEPVLVAGPPGAFVIWPASTSPATQEEAGT